jgi:hypothetical protein
LANPLELQPWSSTIQQITARYHSWPLGETTKPCVHSSCWPSDYEASKVIGTRASGRVAVDVQVITCRF